jgi:hypothetical protein
MRDNQEALFPLDACAAVPLPKNQGIFTMGSPQTGKISKFSFDLRKLG